MKIVDYRDTQKVVLIKWWLTILLLIVGLFAQNTTSVAIISDINDVLYFKDGTFIECQYTLSVSEGFYILELSMD